MIRKLLSFHIYQKDYTLSDLFPLIEKDHSIQTEKILIFTYKAIVLAINKTFHVNYISVSTVLYYSELPLVHKLCAVIFFLIWYNGIINWVLPSVSDYKGNLKDNNILDNMVYSDN